MQPRLKSMLANAHRLLRLVNQLLDFSRLESGAATLAFERRDLLSMVQPLLDGFDPFARTKGLNLELCASRELPEVYVDPEKLDKILCNLITFKADP